MQQTFYWFEVATSWKPKLPRIHLYVHIHLLSTAPIVSQQMLALVYGYENVSFKELFKLKTKEPRAVVQKQKKIKLSEKDLGRFYDYAFSQSHYSTYVRRFLNFFPANQVSVFFSITIDLAARCRFNQFKTGLYFGRRSRVLPSQRSAELHRYFRVSCTLKARICIIIGEEILVAKSRRVNYVLRAAGR